MTRDARHRRSRRTAVALALAAALACDPSPARAATASSANDVCAANANPCNVTQVFDVVDGSTLDFGVRTVQVTGSGQFNFASGSGAVLCGNFTASSTSAVIDANGPVGSGSGSGSVTLEARRLCSGGAGKVPCIDVQDCQIGPCGVRRCTGRPTRTCLSDENCQLGTCGANKRCTGSATFLRCDTNADCDFGTCPEQLTCTGRADRPVACTANADCEFGTCSVGNASIAMGGLVVGNSDSPATIVLRAADSVSISKTINLSSSSAESDGGDLTVEAAAGSITLTAKINAQGGVQAEGGTVEFRAGTDVTVAEQVSVIGGDFDGGSVDLTADRDLFVTRSLVANSAAGAGFGGDVTLEAGRDLVVSGVSSSNKTTLEANGHTDAENSAGDGGTQDLSAGRSLVLGPNTRILGLGSQPDGYGSDVFLESGGTFTFAGDVSAKALGGQGSGGFVQVLASGPMQFAAGGTLDLSGGSGGGGELEVQGDDDVGFAGTATVAGGIGGTGGAAFVDSGGTATLSGTLSVSGTGSGSLGVQACRVSLASGGKLDNKVAGGDNTITARENMKLLAGSTVSAGTGGTNTLVYRTAAKPPVLQGTVTPAPKKVVDGTLTGCPVCGNAELDQGETCDDGNTANGDGCSSLCQNEKCLAQTVAPGYPTVALCEDGDPCTEDFCNTTLNGGTCRHPAKNCADAVACTVDSCVGGACVHAPSDAACSDGNPCTDDFCSAVSGCTSTLNQNPCDDGNACTTDDTCAAAQCVGAPVDGCGFCGDGTTTPPEECDDGNTAFATGDACTATCTRVPCGKPTNGAGALPKSSDALYVLKAAVGQASCSPAVCDVDSSGKILASDALRVLKAAVGQPVALSCPAS